MIGLLISNKSEVREILAFLLTSKFQIGVKESESSIKAIEYCNKIDANRKAYDILSKANSNDRAVKLLKEESFLDVLIAPYHPGDKALHNYLQKRESPLPVIFYLDAKTAQPNPKDIPGLEILGFATEKNLKADIEKILGDHLAKTQQINENEYCPIRTSLLIKATPLQSDIYIRLSPEKFLKIFPKGERFDSQDLEKYYRQKNVEYMYIKSDEMDEFANKLHGELEALLANPNTTVEKLESALDDSQETLQEMAAKVGFKENVQRIAKQNMEISLRIIGQNPKLSNILAKLRAGGNYLSQHSTALAHISCCIAQEMSWTSDNTFNKLILASLLHDTMVTNPELAKITLLKDLEARKKEFPDEQTRAYLQHTIKAAEVVKTFKEVPPDVDNIIIQHHERPNGSGFPRGLSHNYIAPLSALFIVAHDLTQEILTAAEGFSLQSFIDKKKGEFNQGNFKKIMTALEKVKLS